jgi:hypothetical protein
MENNKLRGFLINDKYNEKSLFKEQVFENFTPELAVNSVIEFSVLEITKGVLKILEFCNKSLNWSNFVVSCPNVDKDLDVIK